MSGPLVVLPCRGKELKRSDGGRSRWRRLGRNCRHRGKTVRDGSWRRSTEVGKKKTRAHTLKYYWWTVLCTSYKPPSLSLPPLKYTYNHSHAQPFPAGGLDGWTFIPDGCNDACTGCVTKEHWCTMANPAVRSMKEREKMEISILWSIFSVLRW